jgi:hypothetical protein
MKKVLASTALAAAMALPVLAGCGSSDSTSQGTAATAAATAGQESAYATIRSYDNVGETAELNQRIDQELVPIFQSIPGFVAYYWIDVGEPGGEMRSVTVYDSLEGAEESNRAAKEWVAANPGLIPKATTVKAGPVVAQG